MPITNVPPTRAPEENGSDQLVPLLAGSHAWIRLQAPAASRTAPPIAGRTTHSQRSAAPARRSARWTQADVSPVSPFHGLRAGPFQSSDRSFVNPQVQEAHSGKGPG